MGKRTQFQELILLKALEYKNQFQNMDVIDLPQFQELAEFSTPALFKNVCAKLSNELSSDVDEVCGLLNISKRRFIEAALIEAVNSAHFIMNDDAEMFENHENGLVITAVEESAS